MDSKYSLIGCMNKYDNFQMVRGFHEDLPYLDGTTYHFLPANTTAMYQKLDQGLITTTKIRYRDLLLRRTIDILLRIRDPENGFK